MVDVIAFRKIKFLNYKSMVGVTAFRKIGSPTLS